LRKNSLVNFHDDAPVNFSLYRRTILVGGVLLLGEALRPSYVSAALPAKTGNDVVAPFLEVSQLLIQHRLDHEIGQRLAVAMEVINPALSEQIDELLAIAKGKNANVVEEFFPDIPAGPRRRGRERLSPPTGSRRFSLRGLSQTGCVGPLSQSSRPLPVAMHSARKQQDHPSEVRVLPLSSDFSIVAKLVGSARDLASV
jgi:hypothetical protein